MGYYNSDPSSRALAALWIIVGAVVLWAFLASQVRAFASSEPRQVTFYQNEPSCAGKKIGYLTLRTGTATTEQHRVWVCGLTYRQQ